MKKHIVVLGTLLLLITTTFTSFSATVTAPASADLENSCPLPPPAWVVVTGASPTTLEVDWATVSGAAMYYLEAYNTVTGLIDASMYATGPTATLTGLTPDTEYEVRVSASACSYGPFGGITMAIGSTTAIVIADIILDHPGGPCDLTRAFSGTECVPNEVLTSGNYPAFVATVRDSANTWSGTFAIVAPCPNLLAFDLISSNGVTIQNTSTTIILKTGANEILKIETPVTGSLIGGAGCPITAANNIGMSIIPIMTTGVQYFRRDIATNGYCEAELISTVYCEGGQHILTTSPGNGTLKTQPSKSLRATATDVQISPNPFDKNATIRYSVSEASPVTLALYNTMGRVVRMLEQSERSAGTYENELYTEDLPPGLYYLVMQTSADRQIVTVVKHN